MEMELKDFKSSPNPPRPNLPDPYCEKLSKKDVSLNRIIVLIFSVLIFVLLAIFLYSVLTGGSNSRKKFSTLNSEDYFGINGTSFVPLVTKNNRTGHEEEGTREYVMQPVPRWREVMTGMHPVSVIYSLGFNPRPKFTDEACPLQPKRLPMFKVTLTVARGFYYGYGGTKKDAKKMSAEMAILNLYGKGKDYTDSPDLKSLAKACGI